MPVSTIPIWLQIVIAAAAVTAACFSAFATWKANLISRRVHDFQRNQIAPKIIVRVTTDLHAQTILFIHIENIGEGVAYDIKFNLERPIPQKAFGLDASRIKPNDFDDMDHGPLISGIKALVPGDSRTITWGQYGGLYAVLQDSFVKVIATYRDDQGAPHESLSTLDVQSFEGGHIGDNNPLSKIAKSIDRLGSEVRMVIRGFNSGSNPIQPTDDLKDRINQDS